MKIRIIIPARLNSTRLPGKLLKKVNNKTLIEHIIRRANKISSDSLSVCTDHKDIKNIVDDLGVNSFYSKRKFNNGTERIAFYVNHMNYKDTDLVINVQADEFNFPLHAVKKMIKLFEKDKTIQTATVVVKSKDMRDFKDTNTVKVCIDAKSDALLFSRSKIPFNAKLFYKHIGIYAYRVSTLKKYMKFKRDTHEINESLEQIRFLSNQIKMKCVTINSHESISINSDNDLKLAKKKVK